MITDYFVGTQVLIILGLLAMSGAFLLLEVLFVSFGVLGVSSLICYIIGVICAFQLSFWLGISIILISPFVAYLIFQYGLKKMQASKLVMQAEITAQSGYSKEAKDKGIEIGQEGKLLTDAYPCGQAIFNDIKIDVSIETGCGKKEDEIKITKIDGATIFVNKITK